MKLVDIRVPGARALVVGLAETAFGHPLTDIVAGTLLARDLDRRLLVLPPQDVANRAVAELRPRGVRLVQGRRRSIAQRLYRRAICGGGGPFARVVLPSSFGLDVRHALAHGTVDFELPRQLAQAGREAAAKLGVDLSAPIACIHARDSGYKGTSADSPLDRARSADIATYAPAATLLAEAGYTVVRFGDSRSTPFSHPSVIDLATSPLRADEVELAICLAASLFVTGDSGASRVAYLTAAPLLQVNVVNVLAAFPLRPHDRVLPKRVFERASGRELTFAEQIDTTLPWRKQIQEFGFADNTPEEITDATAELLEAIAGRSEPDTAQRRCGELARAAWLDPSLVRRREKKGSLPDEYLGDGAVARVAANGRRLV